MISFQYMLYGFIPLLKYFDYIRDSLCYYINGFVLYKTAFTTTNTKIIFNDKLFPFLYLHYRDNALRKITFQTNTNFNQIIYPFVLTTIHDFNTLYIIDNNYKSLFVNVQKYRKFDYIFASINNKDVTESFKKVRMLHPLQTYFTLMIMNADHLS